MTTTGSKEEQRFGHLMDNVAESIASASDAEILAEAEFCGDMAAEAHDVRALLRAGVRNYHHDKLARARSAYHKSVADYEFDPSGAFLTADERRAFLQQLLTLLPELKQEYLTVQYRDYKSLADQDVATCLKQLRALGVWDLDTETRKPVIKPIPKGRRGWWR